MDRHETVETDSFATWDSSGRRWKIIELTSFVLDNGLRRETTRQLKACGRQFDVIRGEGAGRYTITLFTGPLKVTTDPPEAA